MTRRPVQLDGVVDCCLRLRADREPEVLIRPVGIEDDETGARVARLLGVRDVLSGLAMVIAPPGPALAVAVAARVASDLSDAASFQGLALDAGPAATSPSPPPAGRRRAVSAVSSRRGARH